MKKTDKKLDNAVRSALTDACEELLNYRDGFQWLTHFADYQRFPDSLQVVCVYDTNAQLRTANISRARSVVGEKLELIGVRINDGHLSISFDTEENCQLENNGSWKKRCAAAPWRQRQSGEPRRREQR